MTAEYILVMHAPQLQVLTHAGTANQPEAFCAGRPGQFLDLRFLKLFLKMHENGVLMACDHDIDVIRVNNAKPNRSRHDFRFPQHHIIEEIGQHKAVHTGGYAKLQAVEQHVNRIRVQVGGTFYHACTDLGFGPAGQDSKLPPFFKARTVGQLLLQLHGHVIRQV